MKDQTVKPRATVEGHDLESIPVLAPISLRIGRVAVLIVLGIGTLLALFCILSRRHDTEALAKETDELAMPVVVATVPKAGVPLQEFVLPGNVTPYTDSGIHARTGGYLIHWHYDLGAHVKKGALLAEIATPEVDQQLAQAEAELTQSEANASNAHSISDRYAELVTTNAVARQDADTFRNQSNATSAAVKSAQANVRRLREMQSFERVYAPFDGVITARNTDTGQLIDSTRELFHLQALQRLRVFANVPEIYSQSTKIGQSVSLSFSEHPGKSIVGKLVRTAGSLDPASRTLLVEIEVDNRDGKIMPGALAQAHFKLPTVGPSMVVPVTSLLFRSEGLRLAVMHGDAIHLQPITIGRDDGQTVQVSSGIKPNDLIVMNPPDSLVEGERVRLGKSAKGGH